MIDAWGEGLSGGLGGPAPDGTTARLYGVIARARRRAVVFRRGPSKWVRLLL